MRPEGDCAGVHRARQLESWATVGVLDHLAVVPLETCRRTQRLGKGFFGGKSGSKGGQGQSCLFGREEPVSQRGCALERLPEPRHIYDINADSNDHSTSVSLHDPTPGSLRHSTVTDFAKFRGWSTS